VGESGPAKEAGEAKGLSAIKNPDVRQKRALKK